MEYKIGNKVEIEEDGGRGGGFWEYDHIVV